MWLLGFKGAVQLQKAMEIDPVTCGEFSKYVFSLTSGRANCLKGGFFYWGAQVRKPPLRTPLSAARIESQHGITTHAEC